MNNILVNESGQENVKVIFNGTNNNVNIGKISKLQNLTIDVRGDNNNVNIHGSPRFGNLRIIVQDNSSVVIGGQTTIEQAYLLARDNTKINIGKDCMISFQVDMRTSDSHSIFDIISGDRVNKPQDITIGDHVWIGQSATISKGVFVSSNSVVGFNAYLQKIFVPSNCIAAGAPAKVVKTGIIWDRRNADNIYTCDDNEIDPYFLANSDLLKSRR